MLYEGAMGEKRVMLQGKDAREGNSMREIAYEN